MLGGKHTTFTRLIATFTLATLLACAPLGCETTNGANGPARTDRTVVGGDDVASRQPPVREVNLLTSSTALNLDDSHPGPDGFAANIYAVPRGSDLAGPVREGALEVLLFDGTLQRNQLASATPRQTWSFTSDELRELQQHTAVGTGYAFTFVWDRDPPFEHGEVTVAARYVPPDPQTSSVYSAPVIISLGPR